MDIDINEVSAQKVTTGEKILPLLLPETDPAIDYTTFFLITTASGRRHYWSVSEIPRPSLLKQRMLRESHVGCVCPGKNQPRLESLTVTIP